MTPAWPKEKTIVTKAVAPAVAEKETLLESIAGICTVLVVGLFVIAFVFQNFEIPSASMEDTLLIGDHVFVDRETFAPASKWMPLVHARDPQRGDIIVFFKPAEYIFLVKRVVGIPGDRIYMRDNQLYVNRTPATVRPIGVTIDQASRIAAFVELDGDPEDTGDAALADELRSFCKQRLRRYEYPHVVRFVEELPRTLTGKVQRFALRDAIAMAPTAGSTARAEAPRTL